jgi:phosphotransferase system HPr-like phosphotransfer protein
MYRAKVTVSDSREAIHGQTAGQFARAVNGLKVEIVLSRGSSQYRIDMEIPALSFLGASADLELGPGATFELSCRGRQARQAFRRLAQTFTEGCFQGGQFELIAT